MSRNSLVNMATSPRKHDVILMPAVQTPRTPKSSSSKHGGFLERLSSRLGPPPQKFAKFPKLKSNRDPFTYTYLEHPKIGEQVLRVTHGSWVSSPDSALDKILRRISLESGSSTSSRGHIPIGISPRSLRFANSPPTSPSSRDPFHAWLHILLYMFHPRHGYSVVSYPASRVLIVHHLDRGSDGKKCWEKKVEFFVLRCYTGNDAKLKAQKQRGCSIRNIPAKGEDSDLRTNASRLHQSNNGISEAKEISLSELTTDERQKTKHMDLPSFTDGNETLLYKRNSRSTSIDSLHRNFEDSNFSSARPSSTSVMNRKHNSWCQQDQLSSKKHKSWSSTAESDGEGARKHNSWAGEQPIWPGTYEKRNSWASQESTSVDPIDLEDTKLFEPGENWLGSYLRGLRTGEGWDERDGKRSPAANIWGAVAVGSKVKFWQLVGGEDDLHPTILLDIYFKGKQQDPGGNKILDLEVDCRRIEEILTLIDDGHWA